jgi:hypothetical protein
VHTRRYAVRLARRECVSASEGGARGRTAVAGMVPGMAGMVPFSWCGTSGESHFICKKIVHSGFSGYKCTTAVQMFENKSCFVQRGCGFATVRYQRQNPSTAHNLHPEFDHFQNRLAFAVDTGQAHGISPRVHDTANMLRFVPAGTPDEVCRTRSGMFVCTRCCVRACVAGIIPCSWQRRVWASSRPSPSAFSVQVVDDSDVLQPSRRTLRRSLG